MKEEIKAKEKRRRIRPLRLYFVAVASMTLVAAICYVLYRYNRSFADRMNDTVGYAVRRVMAGLGNLLPISHAELLLVLSPILVTLVIVAAVRYGKRSWRSALISIGAVLSLAAIVFQIFALGFAPGYYAVPLDEKLGLVRKKVAPEELYTTATALLAMIDEAAEQVVFTDGGFSVMPYSIEEMNAKLISAYAALAAEEEWLHTYESSVKSVVLSVGMSYLHITGVYTFFTGEANINVDFPDYTIPYTAAHELAHQRGIAREEEANFLAFLVCMSSDDPYIRYSGLVNLYEYVISALGRADSTMAARARAKLHDDVVKELRAYSEFYKKYQHSTAGAVSNAVNNSYLQSQGSVGVKSYGMVVDLAVAYFTGGDGE